MYAKLDMNFEWLTETVSMLTCQNINWNLGSFNVYENIRMSDDDDVYHWVWMKICTNLNVNYNAHLHNRDMIGRIYLKSE
jgi:hypothetical protein